LKEYQEMKDWDQDPAPVTGYTMEGLSIPNEPANRHYMKMQEDVATGQGVILPAVEPVAEPPEPLLVRGEKYIIINGAGVEVDVTAAILALV
jgi:hypothetical protein